MKEIGIRGLIFLVGAFCYSLIEIFFRGFTHWTMTLTGGFVFTILFEISTQLVGSSLPIKCLLGSCIITSVEFTVGVLVNIILGWNVWDYSDMPFNILGQVCLPFTFFWFLICIPAFFLCRLLNSRFHKKTVL